MSATGTKSHFILYTKVFLGVVVLLLGLTCLTFGPDITDRDNIVRLRGINTWSALFATAVTLPLLRFLSTGFFAVGMKEKLRAVYIDSLIGVLSMLMFGRTAYVVLSLVNSHFDHSPVEARTLTISDKKFVQNTKGPSESNVYVTSEPGGAPVELDVTPDLFKSVNAGDGLDVKLHPGALGFEWAEVLGKAE